MASEQLPSSEIFLISAAEKRTQPSSNWNKVGEWYPTTISQLAEADKF